MRDAAVKMDVYVGRDPRELPAYTTSLRFAAPIVALWVVIGIALYFYLRARNPEGLARMGEVYGGEAVSPTDVD